MSAMATKRPTTISPPVTSRGDVRIVGSVQADDEVLAGAVISMIGDAAVLRWSGAPGTRRAQVDRLTEVTVSSDGPNTLVFEGVSEFLVSDVGMSPPDAHVKWLLERKGCQSC